MHPLCASDPALEELPSGILGLEIRYHLIQLTLLDIREWRREVYYQHHSQDQISWGSLNHIAKPSPYAPYTDFCIGFPCNVLVMTQDTFSSSLFEPTIHEGVLIYFFSNTSLSKEKALYKYKHWRSLLRNARVSSWHMSLCKTASEWGMRQRFKLKILFLL